MTKLLASTTLGDASKRTIAGAMGTSSTMIAIERRVRPPGP